MPPPILAVVHITGNAGNQGPNAATSERAFANRKNSPGPSAHYYVNRDGSAVHAVDETRFAAWSNGDLDHPDMGRVGVRHMLNLVDHGYNANEAVYLETECVGTATGEGQWTDAQYETVAALIAEASRVTGIEIGRDTVLTHGDINSVNRANCAFIKAHREDDLARLIDLARGNVDVKPPLPITDRTPLLVTTKAGTPWFDIDGSPRPDPVHAALVDYPSPYGVGKLRAVIASHADGSGIVCLVSPTSTKPLPASAPDPAADAKGFARARDAASVIASKSAQDAEAAAAEIAMLRP